MRELEESQSFRLDHFQNTRVARVANIANFRLYHFQCNTRIARVAKFAKFQTFVLYHFQDIKVELVAKFQTL